MASIEELKQQIDLHDLAEKLGLTRPGGRGNYRSPHHDDKSPSLSIYRNGTRWKDHSTDEGGTCVDLVMYVEGCDAGTAVRRLHEMYGIPMDRKDPERRQKSRAEFIAERCLAEAEKAIEYLVGRGIEEEVVRRAISRKTVGFNTWTSDKVPAGQHGHGGPAAAFIVRTVNPGHVVAVDLRYLDPDLNGGTKTQCQGERAGYPWFSDLHQLKSAHTVYLVESPINALSVESCAMPGVAALAIRGTGNAENVDLRILQGKKVVLCMDNDEPNEKTGYCPGAKAAWRLYERLTGLNIAAHLVDQGEWEWNDVNDALEDVGPEELRHLLRRLDPYVIPGVRGDDKGHGKPRVFLPGHDYAQYWRYRAKEDFTTFVTKRTEDDMGQEKLEYGDLCGFRVAGISRVTIASATSTMTGEDDNQPRTLFAVSVQAPRHGNRLLRRVFEDERLHNVDQWKKFGPVFNQGAFLRMINILERGADLGACHAVNFVGLAWRDGRPIVNEGPDCYFTDPDKQCPYHNLVFPSGSIQDARRVIEAYQSTFRANAASLALVWSLGGHLKAFLGFWPHLIMQADKGMGKSTLIKRLERSIAFTMFSGQSLQTEFRLLTSIAHTSHPVGWEEISARRQDVIDKAVSLLQESYQHTVTRRGSDMTEYLLAAPVLLAGEDVPVRSLLGKVVRTDLTGRKGPMMPEDLPRFPVAEWLRFLADHSRSQVLSVYQRARQYCLDHSRASRSDDGAQRMAGNYAAVLTAWRLLCDFAEIDRDQGDFIMDVVAEMNDHIAETNADREPWVWILEILLSEISAGHYKHPYLFGVEDGEDVLCVRTSHIMDHIAHSMALRDKWNALPVKSDRVLKRQLRHAGVLASEDVERTICGRREAHLVAISLEEIQRFGLHASPPVDPPPEV
ncbi:MAG TPA: hypothetical protein ENK05_11620 [Gammaproteobacteria bacterium]|nr:hypothetical protein [Gammaproteobacteria bacterium]